MCTVGNYYFNLSLDNIVVCCISRCISRTVHCAVNRDNCCIIPYPALRKLSLGKRLACNSCSYCRTCYVWRISLADCCCSCCSVAVKNIVCFVECYCYGNSLIFASILISELTCCCVGNAVHTENTCECNTANISSCCSVINLICSCRSCYGNCPWCNFNRNIYSNGVVVFIFIVEDCSKFVCTHISNRSRIINPAPVCREGYRRKLIAVNCCKTCWNCIGWICLCNCNCDVSCLVCILYSNLCIGSCKLSRCETECGRIIIVCVILCLSAEVCCCDNKTVRLEAFAVCVCCLWICLYSNAFNSILFNLDCNCTIYSVVVIVRINRLENNRIILCADFKCDVAIK